MFAPAGTPPDIVKRLNTEIVKIINSPDVREKLAALGAEPVAELARGVRGVGEGRRREVGGRGEEVRREGGLIRVGAASRGLAAAALWLACAAAAAAPLAGRVVHVHDGDTLTVLVDRREVRVRLAGIDAPERGQPFATASRRALSARVAGREVVVDVQGRDGFGRTLGVVRVAGADVNREQVRDGWAWVFRRFSHDAMLLALEDEARRARRGLWRDPQPVPPWTWRETHPPRAPAAAPAGR